MEASVLSLTTPTGGLVHLELHWILGKLASDIRVLPNNWCNDHASSINKKTNVSRLETLWLKINESLHIHNLQQPRPKMRDQGSSWIWLTPSCTLCRSHSWRGTLVSKNSFLIAFRTSLLQIYIALGHFLNIWKIVLASLLQISQIMLAQRWCWARSTLVKTLSWKAH